MATNPNQNEAEEYTDDYNDLQGWFYHAPAARRNKEPVLYPPMSQVPGLAEDDGTPEDPPRPLFRDSDTKYIRLAKQGGRANLLQIKENDANRREPVYYPRNEWFYLEDNAMEDEAEKRKNEIDYDFLRPDYMVHEAYKEDANKEYMRPGRGPLGFDKLSVFEREPGNNATDKTVKLPEVKKPGYGVRRDKPLPRALRNKPQSAQTDPGKGPHPLKYLPMPATDAADKTKISKILGYAYEREWQDELKTWQEKQEIGRTRHRQMTHIPPNSDEFKIRSEYEVNFGKRSAAVHSDLDRAGTQQSSRHSEGKQGYSVRQTETQRLREAQLQKPVQRDPFKMTRFKNIPARIESQRPTVAPIN
ncbi:uncharacterized protein C7orf57 homolog isoform X2 [Ruditapes philippinarum]|uniref:uncharacterized protein C7orf57 homolog isoform X2 n=1 Tax=Ruditapes philippinarum TaxID=129788 RepID=UPI00295AE617|nr:uncharacterized protein C7orf57 homolog isoform X2 [Ruditapes philippinarum]